MLIDTHAHLYSKEFDDDRMQMIDRALNASIQKIFLPNVDLETITLMKKTVSLADNHLFPMIGLHPCSVNDQYREVLEIMKVELDSDFIYYGIGESGIDLYWDKSTLPYQIEALKIQCEWAYRYNLPIILHTRNANEEVISLLEKMENKPERGIFHCFSGTSDHITRIDRLGDYAFGIGGVVTYKNGGLIEMVDQIPRHKIVLETDAPYLAPVPFRGKRNEPSYLKEIAEKILTALNISFDELQELTTNNAERIFAIENEVNPMTIV